LIVRDKANSEKAAREQRDRERKREGGREGRISAARKIEKRKIAPRLLRDAPNSSNKATDGCGMSRIVAETRDSPTLVPASLSI